MKNSEVIIDKNKYKHNEDYRRMIQNRFKDELTQPYKKNGVKNPEFIKRYGEDFYKPKVKVHAEEDIEEPKRKRVILRSSRGSVFE